MCLYVIGAGLHFVFARGQPTRRRGGQRLVSVRVQRVMVVSFTARLLLWLLLLLLV
jgi:hypothetical protein